MYYRIGKHGMLETDRAEFDEASGGIGIFDEEEWRDELKLKEEFSLCRKEEDAFFCKLETHASYLFGMFHIPVKKKEQKSFNFAVYILKDRLIFVEEESYIKNLIHTIQRRVGKESYSIGQFLGDFFMELVEDDFVFGVFRTEDCGYGRTCASGGNEAFPLPYARDQKRDFPIVLLLLPDDGYWRGSFCTGKGMRQVFRPGRPYETGSAVASGVCHAGSGRLSV